MKKFGLTLRKKNSADTKKKDVPTRKIWPDAINFAEGIKVLTRPKKI